MRLLKEFAAWLISLIKLGALPAHRRVSFTTVISGSVEIGDYTYIGGYSEVRGILSKVVIGRYCSIGRSVKIFSSGQAHKFEGLSTYPFFSIDRRLDRRDFNLSCAPTVIGNDVWIGSNTVILPGIRIGNGAVIGAGAIVSQDVEPYSIVAGVPARKLRYRFAEPIQAEVEKSRWWELEYPELRSRYGDLVLRNSTLEAGLRL